MISQFNKTWRNSTVVKTILKNSLNLFLSISVQDFLDAILSINNDTGRYNNLKYWFKMHDVI